MSHDVIVIGAGAIGLAAARDLAADHSVLLLERGVAGRESSWAAAGMLAPHSEASEDDPLFRLGLSSLGMYRDFVRELLEETGIDAEYTDDGTLVLAATGPERSELRSRCDWQRAAGAGTSWLGPEEARALEPHLTLDVLGALHCPDDHLVHPRLLLEALRKSCAIRGVEIRSGVGVEEVRYRGGRVAGIRSGSARFDAPSVVVAAGAWSGGIAGLVPRVESRPRKGQILSLEMKRRDVRHVVRWRQFYLAPRREGKLVVGATNEDCGFDRSLTATGLRQLLEAAERMASGVAPCRIAETWTGLRPETPDGWPVIGPAGVDGLFYAFGHYRNGILLTPVTTRILGDSVRGRDRRDDARPFSPMRFADRAALGEAG